ncbi:hypothetical protein D3C73_1464140 [compost metagenome]
MAMNLSIYGSFPIVSVADIFRHFARNTFFALQISGNVRIMCDGFLDERDQLR